MFWIRGFKVDASEAISFRILHEQQTIRYDLSPTFLVALAMGHVRRQRHRRHIVKDVLILDGAAPSCKGPHDILEFVNIDIIPNNQDSIHKHGRLVVKQQVAELCTKVLGVGLQLAEAIRVHLEGTPRRVRLKRRKRIFNREPMLLTEF